MNWLYYLMEANFYLLIFYGFYRLFLYNETFYNSNRYYLILSSISAFILPILQIGYLKPIPVVDNVAFPPPFIYGEENLIAQTAVPTNQIIPNFQFADYLYPIYLFIAFCFTIKLAMGLVKIIKLWLNAKKTNTGSIILIELNEQTSAFSFFNLLFIHPHLADKQTVLKHEMVHIKQKHSIDILFFEFLQIICWFNPMIYFIKKDITLLHEYIADELTTCSDIQKHDYAMFLIENSFGITSTPLTNQIFNQSILKRRINMLNKKRTAAWAKLRLLLVLPLSGAMLCASTMAFTKDYGYVNLLPEKSRTTTVHPQETPKKTAEKPGVLKLSSAKQTPTKFTRINSFFPLLVTDNKTGKIRSVEKRYIVINGKRVSDLNTFYGITNAQKITALNADVAIKKYGAEAKFGAIEINGNQISWIKDPADGPPPPKMDQIKFPPPIVKLAVQTHFYPKHKYDKTIKAMVNVDKRYVIVNGEPVTDNSTFHGVTGTESVTYISPAQAIKLYGMEKGKNGAVEIKGTNLKYITELKVPPAVDPPPAGKNKVKVVKYPPPVVKQDVIKFPPPVVKPDVIKFPPPVVKPDAKKEGSKSPEELRLDQIAKLIDKLPSITVAEKAAANELVQKLPSVGVYNKVIIPVIKKNR